MLSSTELKLCKDDALPFFSTAWPGLFRLFSESRGPPRRDDAAIPFLVGEFSLLSLPVIGDRSGVNVIRCVIERDGDTGESDVSDFARVSAMRRRACSRRRVCRSSCKHKQYNIQYLFLQLFDDHSNTYVCVFFSIFRRTICLEPFHQHFGLLTHLLMTWHKFL